MWSQLKNLRPDGTIGEPVVADSPAEEVAEEAPAEA